MHSHVRRSPRITDYHPSLAEQRDIEHKRQMRRMAVQIFVPMLIGALLVAGWQIGGLIWGVLR